MAEAATIPLHDAVFFVGAGISSAPPSRLPHAAAFAGEIFDLLCDTGPVYLSEHARRSLKAVIKSRLRLEIFLETLAQEISPETVFAPFGKFVPAPPNPAHFAISLLAGTTIITTNQDLLLEAACARLGIKKRILHLHGACDRIASIVTIISQYLGGLETRTRRAFNAAIKGKTVLVAGYSGRDLDIMPLLIEGAAAIRWILHSGPPSPELVHARDIMGDRLQITSVSTGRWLRSLLSQDDRSLIRRLMSGEPPGFTPMPQHTRAAFTAIPDTARNWAVARVLEQLGRHR